MIRRFSALAALRALGAAALVAAVLAGTGACNSTAPPEPESSDRPQRLPTATIHIGDPSAGPGQAIRLVVEVANSREECRQGMMFRRHLRPDEAMLFVFESEGNVRFWMKNCYVDLDLAYIRSDGTIAQTERMKAHSEQGVYSREPVRFALEVPAGWFKAHGIGVGSKVTIPPEVAADGVR